MRLSQGDISERTGLAIAYISRVEHSHMTPTIQVLERWRAALGSPSPTSLPDFRSLALMGTHQPVCALVRRKGVSWPS